MEKKFKNGKFIESKTKVMFKFERVIESESKEHFADKSEVYNAFSDLF